MGRHTRKKDMMYTTCTNAKTGHTIDDNEDGFYHKPIENIDTYSDGSHKNISNKNRMTQARPEQRKVMYNLRRNLPYNQGMFDDLSLESEAASYGHHQSIYNQVKQINTPPPNGYFGKFDTRKENSYMDDPNPNYCNHLHQGVDTFRKKTKMRICSNCQTRETPSWRRSVDRKSLLCNACGLYQRLHNRPRPSFMNHDLKPKCIKPESYVFICYNCNKVGKINWKFTLNGRHICEDCIYNFNTNVNGDERKKIRSIREPINYQHSKEETDYLQNVQNGYNRQIDSNYNLSALYNEEININQFSNQFESMKTNEYLDSTNFEYENDFSYKFSNKHENFEKYDEQQFRNEKSKKSGNFDRCNH